MRQKVNPNSLLQAASFIKSLSPDLCTFELRVIAKQRANGKCRTAFGKEGSLVKVDHVMFEGAVSILESNLHEQLGCFFAAALASLNAKPWKHITGITDY